MSYKSNQYQVGDPPLSGQVLWKTSQNLLDNEAFTPQLLGGVPAGCSQLTSSPRGWHTDQPCFHIENQHRYQMKDCSSSLWPPGIISRHKPVGSHESKGKIQDKK